MPSIRIVSSAFHYGQGIAVGLVRCGLGLPFLALFGVGLLGLLGMR